MRMKRFRLFAVLALAAPAMLPAGPLSAQTWGQDGVTVFQLPFDFNVLGFGGVMNNLGQVAGSSGDIAAFFTPGSGVTTLSALGVGSIATGINDAGQMTGAMSGRDMLSHAFVYGSGSITDLGAPGGVHSTGFGINASGQVAGDANWDAFLYDGGVMTDLHTLGGSSSSGRAINAAGQVTGFSYLVGDASTSAFLYDGVGLTDMGTLGGSNSLGLAINDAGQVAGASEIYIGDPTSRAFVYSGGLMLGLATLGGSSSGATGISNAGQVVGHAMDASEIFRAALWESSGGAYQAYALDDLVNTGGNSGWAFTIAQSISTDGRYILAQGSHAGGPAGWVVLRQNLPTTTTPEPMSLVLLGTGLLGLAGAARWRRHGGTRSMA